MKKYIAEFFGTFVLALAVLGSLSQTGGIPTALVAGITLGLFVFTVGKVSGTHLNPAVTLGAWSVKKIAAKEVLPYILAQFAGAALAIITAKYAGLFSSVEGAWSIKAFIGETVGTLVFAFGIASVLFASPSESETHASVQGLRAPFIIGGSLAIGATVASGLGASGILNPAVAFTLGSFGLAYIIGPVIGSVAGMWLYKYISSSYRS